MGLKMDHSQFEWIASNSSSVVDAASDHFISFLAMAIFAIYWCMILLDKPISMVKLINSETPRGHFHAQKLGCSEAQKLGWSPAGCHQLLDRTGLNSAKWKIANYKWVIFNSYWIILNLDYQFPEGTFEATDDRMICCSLWKSKPYFKMR